MARWNGCGDHSCKLRVGPLKGMGTNGGCRCAKVIDDLHAEVDRLKAENESLGNALHQIEEFLAHEWEEARQEVFAGNNAGWAMIAEVAIQNYACRLKPAITAGPLPTRQQVVEALEAGIAACAYPPALEKMRAVLALLHPQRPRDAGDAQTPGREG